MMNNPLVSVIVASYNAEKFIVQTLDSVFDQDYDNLELIVSDDASIDTTVHLVEMWLAEKGARFARYQILRTRKNTGISANLNRGAKAATGDYFKFLGSDDLMMSNCVSTLVAGIGNADMAFVNLYWFSDKSTKVHLDNPQMCLKPIPTSFANLPANPSRELLKRTVLLSSQYGGYKMFAGLLSALIKRSAFFDVGLFDKAYPYWEDYPFMCRMVFAGKTMVHTNASCALFRRHRDGISSDDVDFANLNLAQTRYYRDFIRFCYDFRFPEMKKMELYADLEIMSRIVRYLQERLAQKTNQPKGVTRPSELRFQFPVDSISPEESKIPREQYRIFSKEWAQRKLDIAYRSNSKFYKLWYFASPSFGIEILKMRFSEVGSTIRIIRDGYFDYAFFSQQYGFHRGSLLAKIYYVIAGKHHHLSPACFFDEGYYNNKLNLYTDVDASQPKQSFYTFIAGDHLKGIPPMPLIDMAYMNLQAELLGEGADAIRLLYTKNPAAMIEPHPLIDLNYYNEKNGLGHTRAIDCFRDIVLGRHRDHYSALLDSGAFEPLRGALAALDFAAFERLYASALTDRAGCEAVNAQILKKAQTSTNAEALFHLYFKLLYMLQDSPLYKTDLVTNSDDFGLFDLSCAVKSQLYRCDDFSALTIDSNLRLVYLFNNEQNLQEKAAILDRLNHIDTLEDQELYKLIVLKSLYCACYESEALLDLAVDRLPKNILNFLLFGYKRIVVFSKIADGERHSHWAIRLLDKGIEIAQRNSGFGNEQAFLAFLLDLDFSTAVLQGRGDSLAIMTRLTTLSRIVYRDLFESQSPPDEPEQPASDRYSALALPDCRIAAFHEFEDVYYSKKKKIGVLCRTLGKSTDAICICNDLRGLDPDKVELFIFSHGVRDRITDNDDYFKRELKTLVGKTFETKSMIRLYQDILRADLDLLIDYNVSTIKADPMRYLKSSKLATIMVSQNSIISSSSGSDSFDYIFVPKRRGVDHYDTVEKPIEFDTLFYNFGDNQQVHFRQITREEIGIPEDAVVFYNAGASAKLTYEQLDRFVKLLKAVDNAVLLMAPCNPGWDLTFGVRFLHTTLDKIMRENDFTERERIKILSIMPIDVAENIFNIVDVLLSSYPVGGSTTVSLALTHNVPVVTLRDTGLLSGDSYILDYFGLSELVAENDADFIKIAAGAARNDPLRQKIKEAIARLKPGASLYQSEKYAETLYRLLEI